MRHILHIRAIALSLILAALIILALVAIIPRTVLAQSTAQDELRATIKAEILSDPRTTGLSQTQIDAIVDALTAEAQKEGLTAHDITWRPAQSAAAAQTTQTDTCGNVPAPLCALNQAFGFSGSDPTMSVWLGIAAALLILIIGIMLEMRHRQGAFVVPPQS